MFDVCIVGGGASGMATAIAIKNINDGIKVCILEKKEILGKKLLATGNGRCNMTNTGCPAYGQTLEFFKSVGAVTRTDSTGRVYPYSEDAAELTKLMEDRLTYYNVNIVTGVTVTNVSKSDGDLFTIKYQKGKNSNKALPDVKGKSESVVQARNVVIATGGKAGPQFGSSGDGYSIAKNLGHHITRLSPVLTAVETVGSFEFLAGVRAKGEVSLISYGAGDKYVADDSYGAGDKYVADDSHGAGDTVAHKKSPAVIFREEGEIQFTKDGLSGICIFNLSRYLKIPEGRTLIDGFRDYRIRINFLPRVKQDQEAGGAYGLARVKQNQEAGGSYGLAGEGQCMTALDDAIKILKERQKILGLKSGDLLRTIVKEPIARDIYEQAGLDFEGCEGEAGQLAARLTQEQIERIAQNLVCRTYEIKGVKGWNFAQVTSGGVDLCEIEPDTMESSLVRGLFFTGEIIDYDGPCGGYNLQNAWETAMKVGAAIGRR